MHEADVWFMLLVAVSVSAATHLEIQRRANPDHQPQ